MTPPILKRFAIAFEQHKLLGFFIFATIFGLSAVLALQPPPPKPKTSYQATAQISYSNPPPLFTSTGEQLQQQGRGISIDALLSPPVLARIQKKLQLSEQQLRKIIEKRLKINLPKEEKAAPIVSLEYTGADSPKQAEYVLDAIVKEMIEQSRLLNTSQLSQRVVSLEERLADVQVDLESAEGDFYRFISTKGTPLLAVQDGSLFSSITGSEQQQRQLELIIQEIDGQISSIIDRLGLNPDEAYTSAALSADPILSNLRAQGTQLASNLDLLKKDLRSEHPKMVALRKQIETNDKQIQQRAAELMGGNGDFKPLPPSKIRQDSSLDPARQQLANTLVTLKTQKEGLLRQLDSLKKTEKQLRQQYEQFPERQLQQARLAQEVELKRALYQTILTAVVDAKSAEAEAKASFAIIQPPTSRQAIPSTIATTSPLLIMAGGAGLGLAAALGTIFLLATLDDRLHTAKEIRDLLAEREVAILGQLPYVSCYDENGGESPILLDVDSYYISFYERIRSNLRRLGSKSAKVILVTSVNKDEGKSINAYNLAIASAHAGKRTLLLEADLRSTSLAQKLGLEIDSEESEHPLQYYANRSDAVRLVPGIENLYVLPNPGKLRQVQVVAALESDEWRRLIEDIRGRFDMVFVDSSSLSISSDTLLLEPLTDGIVLITRPGITKGSMLTETVEQFTETELPLLGAIINNADEYISVPDTQEEKNSGELTDATSGSR